MRTVETLSINQRRVALLTDIIVVFFSFYLTFQGTKVVIRKPLFPAYHTMYYETLLYTVISWVIALLLAGEYPVRRLTVFAKEIWVVLQVSSLGVFVFTSLSFLLKMQGFSRLFIASYCVVTTILMVLVRLGVRTGLGLVRRTGADIKTRLVVGIQDSSARYIRGVIDHPETGIRVTGFIGDRLLTGPVPYLGEIEDFMSILRRHPVDGVVVTLPLSDPRTEAVIRACETLGMPVELVLDSLSSRLANSQIVHSMGVARMVVSQVPHSPRDVVWKRVTDILLSSAMLIVLSPVLLLIVLAIKLDDGGPVIFSQLRSGIHGKTFRMYKFRSMSVNAEQMKAELSHLNQMSGPVFKIMNDPRVTRVGSVLRKTSLDELPQLFNVLRGDMSLVGPRPPLPSEVDQYNPHHIRRLSVQPGITCLWQVGGRNDIDFDDWMKLDLQYIDTWSYWSDLKILFRTIPAVLKRKGAS
ncbi:sugar transferase [Alicyclobacillus curvatus]|nr:sugar transferase [Alicyclobacillus curvatus]